MLSHRPASALLTSAPVRVIRVVMAWLDGQGCAWGMETQGSSGGGAGREPSCVMQ